MNCNTTHYRANSSSVPGDPTNLWRAHQAAANPAYLNLWRSFALPAEVDLAALPQALTRLVAAHPVLRAHFPAARRGLIQRFSCAVADPEIHDLGEAMSPDDERVRLAELIYGTGRPFDLADGPCFRVAAIRRRGDSTLVLLVVHHILADEWSVDRLADALRSLMLGMDTAAPAVTAANFADYAVWERQCRAEDKFGAQREWWLRDLAPPVGAPDFLAEGNADAGRRAARFTIPQELWQRLSRGAAATGTSMFAALLGILALQLGRRTGQADQRVCTNHARRLHSETEAMVGPLNDLLIVRTRLHDTDSAKAAVKAADVQLRKCLDALDIPFAEVLTAVAREHGIMPRTLAPCFFMLHERDAMREAERAGIRLNSEYLTSAAHDFALLLNVERAGDEVSGELVATAELDTPLAVLTDEYVSLLGELAVEWGQ